MEAATIHRALKLMAGEDGVYSEPEPLDADLVLVDEASMLDIYLAENLFRSLKPGCQVVLVGDADQLPSVGPGAVLRELLSCGQIPVGAPDQNLPPKRGQPHRHQRRPDSGGQPPFGVRPGF